MTALMAVGGQFSYTMRLCDEYTLYDQAQQTLGRPHVGNQPDS